MLANQVYVYLNSVFHSTKHFLNLLNLLANLTENKINLTLLTVLTFDWK